MAAHTASTGMSQSLRLPGGRACRGMVDRVAGGRGEDIGEGLVGAVETVDVVEHDGSTHGVMASVERMVSSHHCLSSSSSSASPSCMGHPVTVQEQIRAWQISEILEILEILITEERV